MPGTPWTLDDCQIIRETVLHVAERHIHDDHYKGLVELILEALQQLETYLRDMKQDYQV